MCPVAIPFDLHGYASRLYARVSTAVVVPYSSLAVPGWAAVENNCHGNVTDLCVARPDIKAIRGWLYFDFDGYFSSVRFTAHSVARLPDGTLMDVTPSRASRRYPFISAEESEEDYAALIEQGRVQHIDYDVARRMATAFGLPPEQS